MQALHEGLLPLPGRKGLTTWYAFRILLSNNFWAQDQCAFAHDVEELVYRPDLTTLGAHGTDFLVLHGRTT